MRSVSLHLFQFIFFSICLFQSVQIHFKSSYVFATSICKSNLLYNTKASAKDESFMQQAATYEIIMIMMELFNIQFVVLWKE